MLHFCYIKNSIILVVKKILTTINREVKEFTIYEETTIIDYYKARGKDPYTDEGFSEIQ